MGWYASEDGLVHVPTRRDFLDQYKVFLAQFDNVLAEVENGWDRATAQKVVCNDLAALKAHPYASDCLFSDDYFLDELGRAFERYRDSPKYGEDHAQAHAEKKEQARLRVRAADRAMLAAAGIAALGWGIEITRNVAPGLEHIINAENIRWFCGTGAATMFAAAVMNYWESKDCG